MMSLESVVKDEASNKFKPQAWKYKHLKTAKKLRALILLAMLLISRFAQAFDNIAPILI